jgi:3-methyladenine DNA glycosylase/8-oxoguanine DNA glycosylase
MKNADHHEALGHLKAADAKLALLIDRVGECRFEVRSSLSIYESLLRSIMYQQLAGSAAAAILKRLQALFHDGDRYPTPEQILEASEETLRSAGLSRNKMLAVKDLLRRPWRGWCPLAEKLASLAMAT